MAANSRSPRSAGSRRWKSNIIALLLAALAPVAPSRAQEAEVSMKLDFIAWGNEIGGLSFKASDKSGDITAHAFRYSQPVAYSGPALMEIHQTGTGTKRPEIAETEDDKLHELKPLIDEPDKPDAGDDKDAPKSALAIELEKRRQKKPTLVALARLPANSRRATVLLAPAGGNTYQAYVINDDPTLLPLGRLRIHNLSPLTIAMRCNGQTPKELKTRESYTTTAPNQQVIYELAYKAGDEWKVQENNVLLIRPNEQTQLIVLRSSNQFFLSADGSAGGFLQTVVLRRGQTNPAETR